MPGPGGPNKSVSLLLRDFGEVGRWALGEAVGYGWEVTVAV